MNFLFGVLVPILGILAGLIAVFFPKKLTALQIKQVSRHNDWLNKQIKSGLSRPSQPIVAVFVGLGLIFICTKILFDYFNQLS